MTTEPSNSPEHTQHLPLAADAARQAVASTTGTLYQLWCSIDAWLRLTSADEVIFLEGAEDLDHVGNDQATSSQLKHETSGLSLNNQRAHEVLENFWKLIQREPVRRVDCHFLTTAPAAREADAEFDGLRGVEAWSVAQTDTAIASHLQTYLLRKLSGESLLRRFLASATIEQTQVQLFQRVHWFFEQPGIEAVERSVADRITVRLQERGSPLELVRAVCDRLFVYASKTITRKSDVERSLNLADLLREIAAATTRTLTVPIGQYAAPTSTLGTGLASPETLISAYCKWSVDVHRKIVIPGGRHTVDLRDVWLPLRAAVRDDAPSEASQLQEVINDYHARAQAERPGEGTVNAISIARFIRLNVVIGGPGMGKSTLLKRIAMDHAGEGTLVLRFSARATAQRMRMQGEGFVEALLALSSDGFSDRLTLDVLRSAQSCILLCDGLDEARNDQERVTSGLLGLVASLPHVRCVVTSRPVGYAAGPLAHWRQYELVATEGDAAEACVLRIAKAIARKGSTDDVIRYARQKFSENSAVKHAARNPLVASLIAVLLIDRVDLAASKTGLYKILFTRLSTTESRLGDSPPPTVVLDAFINFAAWSLLKQPLLHKEQLLELCSAEIAEQLQEPPLRARMISELCLAHWESVGVMETLSFCATDYPTFVHKTFLEFAAARFLAAQDRHQLEVLVDDWLNSDGKEVVEFLASLGGLNSIIHALVGASAPDSKVLSRALKLATLSDVTLTADHRARLCEQSARAMSSPVAREALEVANDFIPFGERYPDDVAAVGAALQASSQPWTRLAALSAMTLTPSSAADLPPLSDLVPEVLQLEGRTTRSAMSYGFGLDIGAFPGSQIDALARHVVKAASSLSPDEQLAALEPIVVGQLSGTTRNVTWVVNALTAYRPDLADRLAERHRLSWGSWLFNSDHDYEQLFAALRHILKPRNDGLPVRDVAWNVSALLSGLRFHHRPAYEHWPNHLSPQAPPVVATLSGCLDCISIDRTALAAELEALEALAKTSEDRRLDRVVWKHTEKVDVLVDWGRGTADLGAVEEALYLPMSWLVENAVNLLAEQSPAEKVEPLIDRVLNRGQNLALWAGAQLTSLLPADRSRAVLVKHLSRVPVSGSHYLLEVLKERGLPPVQDLLPVLNATLGGRDARAAVSAAEMAHDLPITDELFQIIDRAFSDWKEKEGPNPTGSGAIPPSPRGQLLLLMTKHPSFDPLALLDLAVDARHDVSRVAVEAVLAALAAGRIGDAFLERIREGRLNPALLARALRANAQFTSEQKSAVGRFLFAEDRELRKAAIGVLRKDFQPDGCDMESLLSDDEDDEIRELVRRAIS